MVKILIVAAFLISSFAPVCFAEEESQEKGLFSKGSFLSDAISSAVGKFDKVASGGERIMDENARGIPQDTLEYDGNALHRPLPKPSYRHKNKDSDILD